jgi:hypothetical protein
MILLNYFLLKIISVFNEVIFDPQTKILAVVGVQKNKLIDLFLR